MKSTRTSIEATVNRAADGGVTYAQDPNTTAINTGVQDVALQEQLCAAATCPHGRTNAFWCSECNKKPRMHMNVAESEPEIPGNLNGAAGSPLSASSHRVSGKPPKGKSDPLLGRYLVGDYLARPPPLAKDQDDEQPPKKRFLSTAAFELALGDGRTAQHGDVDHLFEECSEEEQVNTAEAEYRIPGVGALTRATRGPSLLGAAPGVCSSPAKAELKMNALQSHKRALAKADLREEFLSGAGCASLLLIEDSDVDDILSSMSNKRYSSSATPAPADTFPQSQPPSGTCPHGRTCAFFCNECNIDSDGLHVPEAAVASDSGIQRSATSKKQDSCTKMHRGIRRVFDSTPASMVQLSQNGKRQCLDDLVLDMRRITAKKRPTDDIECDRRRIKKSRPVTAASGTPVQTQGAIATLIGNVSERLTHEARTVKVPKAQDAPT